ncbi:hypothetical protein E4U14_004167 [Claviceps sp. LM454 group G7]|nr:hypothetical protein E4U14_004167 [Claviceps sp. LM454 group G7]
MLPLSSAVPTRATTSSPQPRLSLEQLEPSSPTTTAAISNSSQIPSCLRDQQSADALSDVGGLPEEFICASAEWPAPQPEVGVDQNTYGTQHHIDSNKQEQEQEQGVFTELLDLLTEEPYQESLYYDASTMAGLNSFSLAAIKRLRGYRPPPFPLWDTLPARKRAAVLVLLYADRWGDLRVVITMRAASLRSFSGHAALPGGKADSKDETPYQIARREAFEEIGLPMDDMLLPKPFRIEPLCFLPPSLARTHLVVIPCVAFLHADKPDDNLPAPLVDESLIPRLDAREVAAVFSAPFYNFLKAGDLPPRPGQELPPGPWYEGAWMSWKDMPWRVHNFHVPVNNQRVAKPRKASAEGNLGETLQEVEQEQEQEGRFKVWGMTGRLLVDAARIAYGEEPELEHNESYGDYDIILRAEDEGVFQEEGDAKKPASNEPSKM